MDSYKFDGGSWDVSTIMRHCESVDGEDEAYHADAAEASAAAEDSLIGTMPTAERTLAGIAFMFGEGYVGLVDADEDEAYPRAFGWPHG